MQQKTNNNEECFKKYKICVKLILTKFCIPNLWNVASGMECYTRGTVKYWQTWGCPYAVRMPTHSGQNSRYERLS